MRTVFPSIHTTSVQICILRWRTIALGWHGADGSDAQTLTEEEPSVGSVVIINGKNQPSGVKTSSRQHVSQETLKGALGLRATQDSGNVFASLVTS